MSGSGRGVRRFGFGVGTVVLMAAIAVAARGADPALDSLVGAERGFARQSVEQGVRSAFVDHLATDAVLFRPGPVNGYALWKARSESPVRLDWRPEFAEISGSEDFGFTTGPWTLSARADTAPSAFGRFVTVWRREPDGPWRVALDIGISHDDPGTPLDGVEVSPGPGHAHPESLRVRGWDAGAGVRKGKTSVGLGTGGVGFGVGSDRFGVGLASGTALSRRDLEWRRTAHEKNRLMSAERTFAFEARTHGWDAAYRKVAAGDLRTLREGRQPALGPETAIEWGASVPGRREWLSRGNGVAPSWDLGYAYGLVISRPKGARPDTAAYVHLWRKDDAGEWRLLLDLESPFPRR